VVLQRYFKESTPKFENLSALSSAASALAQRTM
jgi:hypothetical protein